MPRGGCVQQDEVVRAGPLELLDLAEHEDVVQTGSGRGDDAITPALASRPDRRRIP
jgi:hypothetical protein